MYGIRFYLEHENPKDKRKNIHTGNVIAVFFGNGIAYRNSKSYYDALSGIYSHKNSPVCSTSANLDYLRENCKRISESQSRTIHPELFKALDD